jgi:ribosomal protein S18 acetylase RimI-like enzyme
MSLLATIEACYDAIPRVAATVEEVGPFTLFRAEPGAGWQFYARPRLGLTDPVSADDVRRVLARQRDLGLPGALEWVDEVTPSLRGAVEAAGVAGVAGDLEVCPLLALPGDAMVPAPDGPGRYEVISGDHPDLPLVLGAVDAAFRHADDVRPGDLGVRARLLDAGALLVVAAYAEDGSVVGGGSGAPRGAAAELMGIATIPSARGRGHGSAVTRALVRAVRERGADTVFLSAGSHTAAEVYRRVGFVHVGSAMILEAGA